MTDPYLLRKRMLALPIDEKVRLGYELWLRDKPELAISVLRAAVADWDARSREGAM
jgi:hypothetical protein